MPVSRLCSLAYADALGQPPGGFDQREAWLIHLKNGSFILDTKPLWEILLPYWLLMMNWPS
jgi:hypothetical protein